MPIHESGANLFDVRKPCVKKPLCYDFDAETTWLNAHAKLLTGGR
eukprot:gene1004-9656_t